MVKVNLKSEEVFFISIENLSAVQVNFLMDVFQNSPLGYENPDDEPESQREARKAIFEACRKALHG